jgi:hypothetical protein
MLRPLFIHRPGVPIEHKEADFNGSMATFIAAEIKPIFGEDIDLSFDESTDGDGNPARAFFPKSSEGDGMAGMYVILPDL